MKALCLVVSDKKPIENCISTLLPTYATNWNCFNNVGRGQPRDQSFLKIISHFKTLVRIVCMVSKLTSIVFSSGLTVISMSFSNAFATNVNVPFFFLPLPSLSLMFVVPSLKHVCQSKNTVRLTACFPCVAALFQCFGRSVTLILG